MFVKSVDSCPFKDSLAGLQADSENYEVKGSLEYRANRVPNSLE